MAKVYVVTADWFNETEGVDESNVFVGVTGNRKEAMNIVYDAVEDHTDKFVDGCCVCDELEEPERGFWHYKDDKTDCWYNIKEYEI